MLPRVPSSVPAQCTIACMTVVTLIPQLISSFGTTFSSTAAIPVYQFFSSDMVSPAVCSRFVSPLDSHDIHSYFYISWYEHGNARLVHILRFFPHPVFEDHFILLCYILIRAWECPPRPYYQMIPNSFLRLCTFQSLQVVRDRCPGLQLLPSLLHTPRKNKYDSWCPSAIRWAPALAHQGAIC